MASRVENDECNWLSIIKQQLYERDFREKIPFENISSSYNLLLDENVDLSKKVSDLSQRVLQLKQDNWNRPSLNTPLSNNESNEHSPSHVTNKKKGIFKQNKHRINDHSNSHNDHNNNNNNDNSQSPTKYEMNSMMDENESLRKELMDVYRLKKENEEALSRLKKQSIENEELIMNQTKSINELSIKHQKLVVTHHDLKEEDEILKSNMVLLNNESVELRKAHDNAMKELDQYKDENRRLTEQLLKLKESQMDSMDQLNEEYEKLRKITAAKQLQQQQNELKIDENESKQSPSKRNIKRRNTISKAPKSPKQKQWSFAGMFGMDKNAEKQKSKSPKITRAQTEDFTSSRPPMVDLYGPSLFNISPPQLKQKMWQAHSSDVCALQFDQNGKKLISGGNDKLVKIWDVGSTQEIGVLRGCTSSILTAQYSPNGTFVCAGGNDCQLHLWNVKTQRQIRVYNGHGNKITSLAFTHDSRLIYSGSHDRTIRLWDLETAACRFTMSAHSSVNDLALSPDNYYIATAHLDGAIRFWGKRDRKELFKLTEHQPQQTIGIQFAPPDGITILTSGKDGKIIVWDLRKQQKLHEIVNKEYKNTNLTGKPCYSPDGQYIIGGSSLQSKKIQSKYSLFIWKAKTGKLQHTLTEHTSQISKVIWNGRGGVCSSDRSGMIAMWC